MYESEDIAMHEGLNVDTFIHRVAGLKIQRVQVDNRDSVTVYNIPDSKIQKATHCECLERMLESYPVKRKFQFQRGKEHQI
mgnify:CR=1 FL=1